MPLDPILADIVIIAVLAVIVGGIVFGLVRSRKRKGGCTGCPYAGKCGKRENK